MLNERDLTKMCEEICETQGYNFAIPIKINKRLTTTLGRVRYQRVDNRIVCLNMEFSYDFLSNATPDQIVAVVQHECAHYLVYRETHERHAHDFAFKEMCRRIGCKNDKAIFGEEIADLHKPNPLDNTYKYLVYCDTCKKLVAKYHRAGKIVKMPHLYSCKCGGNLIVKENF